jgi:hypothetical protein
MVDKKTPEWYSSELNKMFGLEGDNAIDFKKLTHDDLLAFYIYMKMMKEAGGGKSTSDSVSPFRGTVLEGTLIDGPLARKLVSTVSAKEMEGLKERPLVKLIIAKAADSMDK